MSPVGDHAPDPAPSPTGGSDTSEGKKDVGTQSSGMLGDIKGSRMLGDTEDNSMLSYVQSSKSAWGH